VSDVVSDLKSAVETARASAKQALADHERVKELLVKARLADEKLGPKMLEQLTDGYFDRATISRMTSEAAGTKRPPASS
jgi:hypothetical protein